MIIGRMIPERISAASIWRRLRAPTVLIALLSWLGAFAYARAEPDPTYPSMKFARVRADNPECRPHCPEWLSAEGKIEVGTAQAFARAISELGERRLPILINSPGGSVADAIAMGRLIRAKRLSVEVAHTVITPCEPPKPVKGAKPAVVSSECDTPTASASAWSAYCASACPLVLAGGVERYVSPLGRVGVHQITMFVTHTSIVRTYRVHYRVVDGRKEEMSRDLADEQKQQTTSKESATPKVESEVAVYLREMGVGGPIMNLMETTPSTTLHWLTANEMKDSGMVTIWADSPTGLETHGANGLAGTPVSAFSGHKAVLNARGDVNLGDAADGPILSLRAEFNYRRGGGEVEIVFSTHGVDGLNDAPPIAAGFDIDWSASDVAVPVRGFTFAPSLQVDVPAADFCKLMLSGKLEVNRYDAPRPAVSIDVHGLLGLRALLDEACPLSIARKAARV